MSVNRYEIYRDQTWYFELIDLVHKVCLVVVDEMTLVCQLFLTSLLVFIDQEAQLPTAISFSSLYFLLIITVQPYLFVVNLRLHLVAQVDLVLFMVSAVLLESVIHECW